MEPSGSEASETRSKDKGNAPVIDVDSENINQHVDEHIDECVTDHVDEQKKKEWGITRVFTATVDNVSSNDEAIRRLHTLLKGPNAILVFKHLGSSSGRQESFKKGVEFEKVACKRKSCLDVDTRWNSMFLMLETAIKFEKVFDRLEFIERDYTSYFYNETEDVRRVLG
ncbi:zinc finger BED domain-containing protein RICESLEEPER 2-like protein [Tanacetum coccineum]